MSEHELKTWPEYFAFIEDGSKTFEVRKDDRGYQLGDTLRLREWDPETQAYSGREAQREVTYLLRGPGMGVAAGYVVMGIRPEFDCRQLRGGEAVSDNDAEIINTVMRKLLKGQADAHS